MCQYFFMNCVREMLLSFIITEQRYLSSVISGQAMVPDDHTSPDRGPCLPGDDYASSSFASVLAPRLVFNDSCHDDGVLRSHRRAWHHWLRLSISWCSRPSRLFCAFVFTAWKVALGKIKTACVRMCVSYISGTFLHREVWTQSLVLLREQKMSQCF